MKTVLVTGGSGFLGSALVDRLAKDHYVVSMDIADRVLDNNNTLFFNGDVRSLIDCDNATKEVDVVYHCAANVPLMRLSKEEYWLNNAIGTRNMLHSSMVNGVKNFVYISSSAVYHAQNELISEKTKTNPLGVYGLSKFGGEEYCNMYRHLVPMADGREMAINIVRPRTIIGKDRIGVLSIFFDWISKNKNCYILGDGSNRYQLLHLDDLIGFLVWMRDATESEDYNLGTDNYLTLKEELEAVIQSSGSTSKVVSLPSSIVKPIIRLLDKLNVIPIVDWHYETVDKHFAFNVSKAKGTGWEPMYTNYQMLLEAYLSYCNNKNTKGNSPHLSKVNQKLMKYI